MKLEIPAGALDAPTVIDAALVEDEPVLGPTSAAVGPTYRLAPSGLVLKKPARLTVPVFPSALANYSQTTADCAVWLEEGDATWRQAAQVASDEHTVTVETNRLGAGAAGVKFQLVGITTPLAQPCTNPSGFCVTAGAQKLRNSSTQFSNITPTGFLYYRHNAAADAGVVRTIAEYAVPLGRHERTSVGFPGPTSRNTALPALQEIQQRVALAPDGTVWAPQVSGVIQVPFTGTATAFADTGAKTRTAAVVFTPDGKRHRIRLTGTTHVPPSSLAITSTATGASEVQSPMELENDATLFGIDYVPVHVVGAGNAVAYAFSSPSPAIKELTSPPAGATTLPVAADVAGIGSRNTIDELAISADGNVFAVSLAKPDSQGRVVFIRSRDGAIAQGIGGLPNLSALEFASDGALYAASATAAQVFHIDPATGGVQTIALTTAAFGTPEYAARIPVALRRMRVPTTPVRHVMVAITGTGERSVLLIEKAP